MATYLAFALLGLGAGAVYGVGAQALVLIHRAVGVINFAQGAIMMYAIYTYVELRDTGDIFLPIPFLPAIELGGAQGLWVAFPIALGMAVLLGLGMHFLVFRPLRDMPTLAKTVAAIGALLAIQGLALVRFGWPGKELRSVSPILPTNATDVLGISVPQDRWILVGLLILATLVLTLLFERTVFGLASRAAVANEKGAVLRGCRTSRLAAVNWVIASVLISAFGILAAPIMSIAPDYLPFTTISAMAAALVARFASFWIAALAGLGLGATQSVILKLQVDVDWLPDFGLQDGIPLLVLIVLVPVFGRSLLARDTLPKRQFVAVASPRNVKVVMPAAVAVGLLAILLLERDLRLGLITTMISTMVCLAFVILTGFTGQVSVAQMALAGIGAFGVALLGTEFGLPFPISPILAAAVATGVGILIGLPALRLTGSVLAAVSIAGAMVIEQFAFNNADVTGGMQGREVTSPSLFGLRLGIQGGSTANYPRIAFAILVLTVTALCCLVVINLRRSATGRSFLALRSNERAAASLGHDIAKLKVIALALSSFLAGLAGALFAYQDQGISSSSFRLMAGLTFLAYAYIGGITSVKGAIFGGIFAIGGISSAVLERIVDLGAYQILFGGFVLVSTTIFYPAGMGGFIEEMRISDRILSLFAGRSREPADFLQASATPARSEA